MVLKAYYDLMSQPSRALVIFLRHNKIPFEEGVVALRKGEHFTDEFKKVNPFSKVPAIDDDGFTLTESSAILRYVADAHLKDEKRRHWYPKDLKLRAKVDEYLDWHHLNLRYNMRGYVQTRLIQPITKQHQVDVKKLETMKKGMNKALDGFESYFLQDRQFIVGDQISLGDLQAACEVEQVLAAGYNPLASHNRTAQWFDRVKAAINPVYDDNSRIIREVAKKIAERLHQANLDTDVPK